MNKVINKAAPARETHKDVSSRETFFQRQDNTLAIYTASRILQRISERFGAEAAQEYLKVYTGSVEGEQPALKAAVDQALNIMNVEKMYAKAMSQ